MPSKPAPSQNPDRPTVYEGSKPTPKINALLEDPVVCSRIAGAFDAIKAVGVAVIFDLPLFCKRDGLDASATVLAANKILTTLEVFKDQGELDRKNATKRKPNA